jgi:hypothetical protein
LKVLISVPDLFELFNTRSWQPSKSPSTSASAQRLKNEDALQWWVVHLVRIPLEAINHPITVHIQKQLVMQAGWTEIPWFFGLLFMLLLGWYCIALSRNAAWPYIYHLHQFDYMYASGQKWHLELLQLEQTNQVDVIPPHSKQETGKVDYLFNHHNIFLIQIWRVTGCKCPEILKDEYL